MWEIRKEGIKRGNVEEGNDKGEEDGREKENEE